MNLTLALPALVYHISDTLPPLDLPSFNKILRFGTFTPSSISSSALYARFLWKGSLLGHALNHLHLPPGQPSVFASPVWQQMGMHNLSMLGGTDIQIQLHEAEQLCSGLNDFFREDGWAFRPVRADLWLVTVPRIPNWQVPPVLDVLGQVDGSIRAEGPDGPSWLQKQTEIQMWLHNHPLNVERTAAGIPTVNGVWLWQDLEGGQTAAPILACDSSWAQFYSGTHLDVPYDFAAWEAVLKESGQTVSDGLLFLDDLAVTAHTADVWAYKDTLESWEQRWFAPLWQALCEGRLKNLCIVTDGPHGGELHIKAKAGRAFWKKKKTFAGQL